VELLNYLEERYDERAEWEVRRPVQLFVKFFDAYFIVLQPSKWLIITSAPVHHLDRYAEAEIQRPLHQYTQR